MYFHEGIGLTQVWAFPQNTKMGQEMMTPSSVFSLGKMWGRSTNMSTSQNLMNCNDHIKGH